MMITNNPEIASYIEQHGVARIFIDQETLGKQERQGHLNTHKAAHTVGDVKAMKVVIKHAEIMVRVNPLNPLTSTEVEQAIEAGATRLMLPMFRNERDVAMFQSIVKKRVPVTWLAETSESLQSLSSWIKLLEPEDDEIHIGLNDLSLDLGQKFLFEPLSTGMLDVAAEIINNVNIDWGFGGIARVGTGALPAEFILGEHVRLGSSRLILSRAFHHEAHDVAGLLENLNFPEEIEKLNESLAYWHSVTDDDLDQNQARLAEIVTKISASLK